MANVNIRTPRFYVDLINFLKNRDQFGGHEGISTGTNQIDVVSGNSVEELYDMRPLNQVEFNTTGDRDGHVNLWFDLKSSSWRVDFIAILNHNMIQADAKVEAHLQQLRSELGPISTAEKRVALIFLSVVLAWMLRRPVSDMLGITGVSDAMIAMTAAMLLFIIPSGEKEQYQLITWPDVTRLPWGVLILFGGGLSLASAVSGSGLALWLGETVSAMGTSQLIILIILTTALVIFLTELTSNLATTATFLPVMGAIAIQQDLSPLMLSVPITLAASCAFMLPVATPPNAIVFASGMISIPQMIRSGLLLNIIGLVLLTFVAIWWAPFILN